MPFWSRQRREERTLDMAAAVTTPSGRGVTRRLQAHRASGEPFTKAPPRRWLLFWISPVYARSFFICSN